MRKEHKKLDENEYDDDIDFYTDTYCPNEFMPSEKDLVIEKEIIKFFQSFVDNEIKLDEKFVSTYVLDSHYKWHCLAKRVDRKSIPSNIYYDFNNRDKYRLYEEKVSSAINNTNLIIVSLCDTKLLKKYFRKLFEGNCGIRFTTSCGIMSNGNPISFGVYAYSTDVTENYSKGNTVSVVFMTPAGKTISMYPVDAHKFESKFNSIISGSAGHTGEYICINND